MNDSQPVFMQIMETIENDIITGEYKTNELIISTTQISKLYSVNPTTAVKAVSKLTDAGILYKKRGIGMCVSEGAKEKIIQKRKEAFLGSSVSAFVEEAKMLNISIEDIIHIIKSKGSGTSND